jgi:hypothetical protein
MTETCALPIKHCLRLLIVLILVLLAGGCSSANLETGAEEANGPRTFYDTLDLDTPQSAVQTFVNFYRREDFYAVFLILSPKTQARWNQMFGTIHHLDRHLYDLPFHHLFKAESAKEVADILADTPIYHAVPLMKEWIMYPWAAEFQFFEHRNTAYYFDFLMFSAKQHSALISIWMVRSSFRKCGHGSMPNTGPSRM